MDEASIYALFIEADKALKHTDYVTARKTFEEIAKYSPEAELHIAWMLEKGLGTEANLAEAERRYRNLSDAGYASGKYYLGSLLLKNHRYEEALKELGNAAELGHSSAAYWASELTSGRYGLPRNEQQHDRYLKRAADFGHIFAKRDLALKEMREASGLFARIAARGRYLFLKMQGLVHIFRNHDDVRVR